MSGLLARGRIAPGVERGCEHEAQFARAQDTGIIARCLGVRRAGDERRPGQSPCVINEKWRSSVSSGATKPRFTSSSSDNGCRAGLHHISRHRRPLMAVRHAMLFSSPQQHLGFRIARTSRWRIAYKIAAPAADVAKDILAPMSGTMRCRGRGLSSDGTISSSALDPFPRTLVSRRDAARRGAKTAPFFRFVVQVCRMEITQQVRTIR